MSFLCLSSFEVVGGRMAVCAYCLVFVAWASAASGVVWCFRSTLAIFFPSRILSLSIIYYDGDIESDSDRILILSS